MKGHDSAFSPTAGHAPLRPPGVAELATGHDHPVDPRSHKVVFQNRVSHSRFGDISSLTCHENIAGCTTPCSICKMPETAETGKPTASEVALPNDEYLLVQWAKVEKRRRAGPRGRNHQVLVKKLSATSLP